MRTFLITAVFASSWSVSFAGTCVDWSKQCKNIQKFRSEVRPKKSSNSETECKTCGDVGKINGADQTAAFAKSMISTIASAKNFDEKKFTSCLQNVDRRFHKLQIDDIAKLKKALFDAKVTSVTVDQLRKLFFDKDSVYTKQKDEIKNGNPEYFYFRDYTLNGPYQIMEESLRGTRVVTAPDGSVVSSTKYDRPVLDELSKFKSPTHVFKHLVARAEEISNPMTGGYQVSPNQAREALTPTVAKLILFEVFKDALRTEPKKIEELVQNLELKFDYLNPSGASAGSVLSASLHNGYFLGAGRENYPNLTSMPASVGIDCTSLIQRCQEEAGVQFPPEFKLLSSRVVSMVEDPMAEATFPEISIYKLLYSVEKLECEAQIEPGDSVVFNGHAFVFNGYKKDKRGLLQLSTYEAIAGEYRSAGEFFREIYGGDACESPVFSSAGERNAFILRVKK